MLAVLLTVALFMVWSVIGLAALVAVRADVRELRIALTAPILGSALTVVPLFVLSNAGVPMKTGAPPVWVALLVASVGVLAWHRPRLSLAVAPVIALCLLDLALLGRPMLEYGFDWIANANGDMAFYVLSATHLVGHGLQSAIDVQALADNRGFPSSTQDLTLDGLRAGTQVELASLAAITGKPAVALYMPMSLAIVMTGICATAALAMQASRRWWAASVAAALLVASPLAGYGVLQQLLPQNWGLGLAVALFAWLLRPGIHRDPGPRLADLVVISVLFAALFIVAYEVAISVVAAYGLYAGVLLVRRRMSIRAVALLWTIPVVGLLVAVNTFLPRAIGYIDRFVLRFGTTEGFEGPSQFGYAIVPTALPGVVGLQSLFESPESAHSTLYVLAGAALFACAVAVCLTTASRGAAAGVALVGYLAIGVLLARNGNEFGLFKLYMYSQPFLAAAVAVWLSSVRRTVVLAVSAAVLLVAVGFQLRTLNAYVDASRDPIDLPQASQPDLLPRFRQALDEASRPLVTVTDNFALGMLEGAEAEDRRVFFISRNLFSRDLFDLPWTKGAFDVEDGVNRRTMAFGQNTAASRALSNGSCSIVLPTGSQVVLNRRSMPEGMPDLVVRRCARVDNALVFVVSSLGQPATLPESRQNVSFWQLERDPFIEGRTFAGFGRYALLQIINPGRSVRIALDVSASAVRSARALPQATVIGSQRVRFPLVGSGSARVFSPPIRPLTIDRHSYVVLDMGRDGAPPEVRRPGATGFWGAGVELDPRSLTSYVRDVSLVGARAYEDVDPPSGISTFPEGLTDADLEYSGIYEDGWVDRESYAQLACGPASRLVMRADVLDLSKAQLLRVLVNGRLIVSRSVAPGPLSLNVPVSACSGRRKVELRWASAAPISPADSRLAAALLYSMVVRP